MNVKELRKLIKEELNEVTSNPTKELIKLLKQAISLADANRKKADNFDLEDFSQTLDKYIDDLNDIGKFEKYED